MSTNPFFSFLIFLILTWLAFLFLARLGGVQKGYLKLSKSTAKAFARPAANQIKKNQKFLWGMAAGGIVLLYILSKLSEQ